MYQSITTTLIRETNDSFLLRTSPGELKEKIVKSAEFYLKEIEKKKKEDVKREEAAEKRRKTREANKRKAELAKLEELKAKYESE